MIIIALCSGCALLMVTSGLVFFINEDRYPRAIKFVDPAIALVSIAFIIMASLSLTKRLALVLLQGTPDCLNVEHLKDEMLKLCSSEDLLGIHEFHIWNLMHGQIVANLHVTYKNKEVSCSCIFIELAQIQLGKVA